MLRRWLPFVLLVSCTSKQIALDAGAVDASEVSESSAGLEIGPEVACTRGGTPGVFTESRDALGITFQHTIPASGGVASVGGGVAVADFDGDGALDIYFANSVGNDEVYLTRGKGPLHFEKVAYPPQGVFVHVGAFAADADGDGDVDILFSPPEQDIAINDGSGGFTYAPSNIPFINHGGFEPSASWVDLNLDGHLDVCIAGGPDEPGELALPGLPDRCFLGDGHLGFTEMPFPTAEYHGQAFIVGIVDVDNDADPDIYVVNDWGAQLQPNSLFINDGHGGFPDKCLGFDDVAFCRAADVAVTGMGLAIGDVDNDGWLDLFTSAMRPADDVLLRNLGDGSFEDVTAAMHAGTMEIHEGVSWGAQFIDVENDGDEDLFVVHGYHHNLQKNGQGTTPNPELQPDVLLINQGGAGFVDGSVAAGVASDASGRSPVEADLDGDGFPDLVVGNIDGRPDVYLNGCSADVAWIGVRFKATTANPSALGTRVDAITDGVHHIREIGSGSDGLFGSGPSEVTIGLGGAAKVDTLRVVWPGGATQAFTDVPVRRWVTVTQTP